MRIGISVLTHAGQSVWENGLGQNIFFLVQLLRTLPFVTGVVLLDCGDQARLAPEAQAVAPELALVPVREACDLVDVVFEMGGGLDVEWLDYVRARGVKVVFFCCGQPYVGLVEPVIFGRGGYFSRPERCDEIWVLAKDRAFMPMLEALHRCAVHEVPFLWDSVFIERRRGEAAAAGLEPGWVPRAAGTGPRALRVATFEPNISVVKCCVVPVLVCEAAFRSEPAAVERLHVLNSVQMREHPTFSFLLSSLELQREGRVQLEQRHDFVGYMSQHADTVVAHQWHNDQNILYLDALYGGYPLVHNSRWLEGVGYYYPDSDIVAGAAQLLRVAHGHDGAHAGYERDARAFLARLSPRAAANGAHYARRLLSLAGRRAC
ncbi:DUF2827 family protein [Paraburkholderia kururiensis]|jgi:hypothetical protein|uniref:DUF2827 family protein n=1 Tax=Paraburkholderia kururiensis TaxID=984307 RepID=UPI0018F298C6|nr:DUF2827 family protein [Paraburkholderia kururiensis]